jgi:L-alanine-DL-glutamate epimerase-like enolase superfamily enzyme
VRPCLLHLEVQLRFGWHICVQGQVLGYAGDQGRRACTIRAGGHGCFDFSECTTATCDSGTCTGPNAMDVAEPIASETAFQTLFAAPPPGGGLAAVPPAPGM